MCVSACAVGREREGVQRNQTRTCHACSLLLADDGCNLKRRVAARYTRNWRKGRSCLCTTFPKQTRLVCVFVWIHTLVYCLVNPSSCHGNHPQHISQWSSSFPKQATFIFFRPQTSDIVRVFMHLFASTWLRHNLLEFWFNF